MYGDPPHAISSAVVGASTRYVAGVAKTAPDFSSRNFTTPNQIGLIRWQEYARKLSHSPGLIAFFPFQRTVDDSVLANQVESEERGSLSVPNGRIEGARWTSGRWPGKDSLLFDDDDEFVQIVVSGEAKEITIAAWIKIDRLDYEMNAILNSDYGEDGDVHFQMTRQGILRDKALENSMIGETKAFFREVLKSGLTLREFLHSDWSMLNPQLAQFYGLPMENRSGVEFQRVSLPAGSHRGGLLTQASILSLTSDGVRHRPVHRGVWLSETIFGKSPPPPPANVNPIPTNPAGPKATLRQKLEAHVHDANCAVCHAKIDPLGLAFENFDAIGRWRTEEVTDGIGDTPKLSAAGSLPDGRAYETADGFKKLLLADLDAFHHTFIEKLATYALRRSMSFDDRDDLNAIAAASKSHDHRVIDIVTALVTSDLFQKR